MSYIFKAIAIFMIAVVALVILSFIVCVSIAMWSAQEVWGTPQHKEACKAQRQAAFRSIGEFRPFAFAAKRFESKA